jgi:hypothetical protein
LIAQANVVGFEEPTALFHHGDDPIHIFTWASSAAIITVSKHGILRKWNINEVRASDQALDAILTIEQSFIMYELDLGIVTAVGGIVYEGSSLAVVSGDDIWRYKEVDGEVLKDDQRMNVPGLSAIVLHGCGSQLSYAGTPKGL